MQLDLNQTKISVPTDEVLRKTELVNNLNQISVKISNQAGKGVTTWHFDQAEMATKAVLMLQEEQIAFKWVEEKIPALIIQQGDVPNS
ncbi:MAG: hypothetical protein AAGJ18_07425 [Bacteroidota bacterium]